MQCNNGTGTEARSLVLLVYYSAEAHGRLMEALEADGLRVYAVDGRAHDASEDLRAHPSRLVVIDCGAGEISVTQAVRRVGQILPDCVIATVGQDAGQTEVFERGRRIGVEATLRAAARRHVRCPHAQLE